MKIIIFSLFFLFSLPNLLAMPQTFSLSAEHVPIRPILEKMAKALKQNVILTDGVQGYLSVHLHNMLWSNALQAILQTANLTAEKQQGVLIIMPKVDYEKYKQQQLNFQKDVSSLSPLQTLLLNVHYASAKSLATLIGNKSKGLLSKRGRVSFDERTNTLLLDDIPSKLPVIKHLVKQMDKPIAQVLVQARIVNLDREFEQEVGVRFALRGPEHLSSAVSGRMNIDMPATSLFANPGQFGLAIAKVAPGVMVDMELSALEKQHLISVMASPRLIASHAQEAIIESGTEIPYQEQIEGGGTSSTFKKAVMRLAVKPQITTDHKVLLTLSINQDKPGQLTRDGLAINTEHLQTQILVNNKQTIIVGGIYETIQRNTVERVPFFSALPLLGHLFTHRIKASRKHELLIFITPEILS